MKEIAFDVDGTLLDLKGNPNYPVINFLLAWAKLPDVKIYVWSGGGGEYATQIVRRLGLESLVTVAAKGSFTPAIAFDDMEVTLGLVNFKVN